MPLIYPMISNEFDAEAVLRFYGNSKSGTASSGWFPYSNYDSSQPHILSDPNEIFTIGLAQSGTAYYYSFGNDVNGYIIEAEIITNTMNDNPTGTDIGTDRWFSGQISWFPGLLISNNPDDTARVITVLDQGSAVAAGTTNSLTVLGDAYPNSGDILVFQYRTDTNTTLGSIEGYVDVKIRLRGFKFYAPTS